MPIKYTLEIIDWSIPDEIPIWDDNVGPGNYPNYLDDDGRQYNPSLQVKRGEHDGHPIWEHSGCCEKLTGVMGGMSELAINIGGNYKDNDLWLYFESRKGPQYFKLNLCPFCGEEVELVCDRVIIKKPTFSQQWGRKGSEIIGEGSPEEMLE